MQYFWNTKLKSSFCLPIIAVLLYNKLILPWKYHLKITVFHRWQFWRCENVQKVRGSQACQYANVTKTRKHHSSTFAQSFLLQSSSRAQIISFFTFQKMKLKNLLRAAANQSIWPQNILPRKRFNNLNIYIFGWVGVKQNKYSTNI